jgi:hypothetical protein
MLAVVIQNESLCIQTESLGAMRIAGLRADESFVSVGWLAPCGGALGRSSIHQVANAFGGTVDRAVCVGFLCTRTHGSARFQHQVDRAGDLAGVAVSFKV